MRDHLGGKTVWRRRLFLSGGCNGDNLRDNNNNDHNISLHLLASRDIQSNTSTYNATSISDATSQMQLPSQMAFLDLTCLESWQVGGCSGTPPVGCLPGCKSLSLSKMMITMANLAVLLFKLSQDSLLNTEYGLSPLHSCELPAGRFNHYCSTELQLTAPQLRGLSSTRTTPEAKLRRLCKVLHNSHCSHNNEDGRRNPIPFHFWSALGLTEVEQIVCQTFAMLMVFQSISSSIKHVSTGGRDRKRNLKNAVVSTIAAAAVVAVACLTFQPLELARPSKVPVKGVFKWFLIFLLNLNSSLGSWARAPSS